MALIWDDDIELDLSRGVSAVIADFAPMMISDRRFRLTTSVQIGLLHGRRRSSLSAIMACESSCRDRCTSKVESIGKEQGT